MSPIQNCPECGADWKNQTCQDNFGQLLSWEAENPALAEVHHLTVLCYHLQHPSLYSPEALAGARELLTEFVVHGTPPAKIRRRNRAKVDSGKRTWPIGGTAERHGKYGRSISWQLTVCDVVAGGAANYCTMVKKWARSVHATLQEL